jgi:hypothetical protein
MISSSRNGLVAPINAEPFETETKTETESETKTETETETKTESEKETETETESEKKDNAAAVDLVSTVFSSSAFMFLAGLLLVYLVVFIFYGMYLRKNEDSTISSRISTIFDFIVIGAIIVYLVYFYRKQSVDGKGGAVKSTTSAVIEFYDNPLYLFSTLLFVAVFFVATYLLGMGSGNRPFSILLIQSIAMFVTGTMVIHNCLKYFFNIDLLDELRDPSLQKYLDPEEAAKEEEKEKKENPTPEVFNLSNNLYTYDDAQAICRAYDSRLATYDEIETAYTNGAEWCNYGWSADQMAFFPTQKSTWNELQQSKKHKNSCGRPGVNGGFFANPNIKFGINCFGNKPKAKENDLALMENRKDRPYPRTEEEKKMDELVDYWKEHSEDKLRVSSFNRDKWSRY